MSTNPNDKNPMDMTFMQAKVDQAISQQQGASNSNPTQSRNEMTTNNNNNQASNNNNNQILVEEKKLTLSQLVANRLNQRINLERQIQIREYIVQVLVKEASLVEQVQKALNTIEDIYVNPQDGWKLRNDKTHPSLTGKVYVSASKISEEILKRIVKNQLNNMAANILIQQGDNKRINYHSKYKDILSEEERIQIQSNEEASQRLIIRLSEEEQETKRLRALVEEVERLKKQTAFDKDKIQELNTQNTKHQNEKNDLKKKLTEQEKLVGGKVEMQKIIETNKKEQEEIKKREDKLNDTIKELKNDVHKQKDELKVKDKELDKSNMVIDQLEEKMILKDLEFLEKQKEIAELKKKMALFQPEIQFCQQQLLRNFVLAKEQVGGEE